MPRLLSGGQQILYKGCPFSLIPHPSPKERVFKMTTPPTAFRLKGKRFHLTYSQCPLERDRIFEFLSTLGKDVIRCRIGCELHDDGSPHRHVAIEYASAWDRRNASSFFDIDGFHPQILPKRTKSEWSAAWEYAKKEGDFADYIDEDEAEKTSSLSDLVEGSKSYKEFLDAIDRRGTQFGLAKEMWRVCTSRASITLTDENISEHAVGTIPSLHLQALRFDPDESRSVILQGNTELGKTTWAMINMPKPCLWVNQVEDLRDFREGYHKSIIFDDVCYQHRPRSEQLYLVCNRQPRNCWARYTNIRLPRGVYKVFTCNAGTDKLPVMYNMGDDAIDSRCKLIQIS